MKLSANQIQRLAKNILEQWKTQNLVSFKVAEDKVLQRMQEAILADYQKEAELERDVNKMLDQLEKSHSGEFQRHKMYPMLKQKLAKERKVIL